MSGYTERKFQEKLPGLSDKEGAKNISTEICSAFIFSLKEVHEFLRESTRKFPELRGKHPLYRTSTVIFPRIFSTCSISENKKLL